MRGLKGDESAHQRLFGRSSLAKGQMGATERLNWNNNGNVGKVCGRLTEQSLEAGEGW